MNPLFRIDFSISDSLKIVRKSVLIYETIILGVSKPSVSRAVKELTKSGHIIKKDGTLYLTQQGRQYAEQICERYQFFTARLVDAGVDRKTAEHDACNIEHAISAEAFQKLKSSLTNK